MLVECMGGNAYSLIGDPADVEMIQSMYSSITSHHTKTEGGGKSMECPKCHSQNREGARFCYNCGFNLASSPGAVGVSASSLDTGKRRDDVLLKLSSGTDMRKSIEGYPL
jgi:hypothetical protein